MHCAATNNYAYVDHGDAAVSIALTITDLLIMRGLALLGRHGIRETR